ncbi:cytochrome bc1 complex diheme cytochrome c subunit [Demequina sp.]|uniref:cytochrome bc1 complex diheme cytochrome c subunit n=1 Tax=Demequina sp. TaxID=2050685 RepID=UPI003D0C68BD
MNALARRRYSKSAPVLLVLILLAALTAIGFVANGSPADAATATADDVAEGQKLFAANCASCHGLDAQGTDGVAPSLIGVGAAAVDFQVGTGRMPMQASGPQVQEKKPQFDAEQISQLAAYVASLGEGPAIPTAEMVDPALGDAAVGMEIFRTNCAMCHGSIGGGGALTQGKFAPNLWSTSNTHIYEAMLVGPQSMPVFNDANITPENKRNIIAYLDFQQQGSPGGLKLGSIGPVAEGFWGWLVALGLIIASTIYVGARAS